MKRGTVEYVPYTFVHLITYTKECQIYMFTISCKVYLVLQHEQKKTYYSAIEATYELFLVMEFRYANILVTFHINEESD